MKIMKGRKEKTENKRTYILMLLIVMLMLICIIAICVVGAHSVRPSETAELNKDVEQKEEKISAAVDIAATSIGTRAKATFTASTGEIHIYNSSTSADATISKSSWNTFLKKIITADGNFDAVKSIKIGLTKNDYWKVYAPADSSNLFSPVIDDESYPFRQLSSITWLNNLDTSKVTTMESMFSYDSSLISVDMTEWDVTKCGNFNKMFFSCSSLASVNEPKYRFWEYNDTPSSGSTVRQYAYCSSLVSIEKTIFRYSGEATMENCTSLKFFETPVSIIKAGTLHLNDYFLSCGYIERVDFSGLGTFGTRLVLAEGWEPKGWFRYAFDRYADINSLVWPVQKNLVYMGQSHMSGDNPPEGTREGDFCLPVGSWWVVDGMDCTTINSTIGAAFVFPSEPSSNRVIFKRVRSYSISYNLSGGTHNGNPASYSTGSNFIALNQPTKPGCKFLGWTGSNGTTPQVNVVIDPKTMSGNLTYTANWQAESASYQVRHWKQNINGNANTHDANNYTLANTENKTGPIGTSVTPPVNTTYTGFNTPATQTKTIAASGTVIDYWYTRKSFTVALNRGTGISSVSGAKTYLYGANVTIDATVSDGYTWLDWTGTQKTTTKRLNFTMPAANVTYTANATPNTNTRYIVRHWQQKVNGNAGAHDTNNYTLVATENKTGTTGANVTPPVKSATEYVGFIPPGTQTKQIAGNGNMVIDYYYARQSYQVNLNKGTGINTVTGGGSYLYGANVTINATLLPGYSWKDWTGTHQVASRSHSFTMPAGNVTDTANATIDTYRITYNLNGGEVSGNPESYTAETASFTLVNPTKAGYTFTGWTGSNGETALETVTISKGSIGDRNYIANWVANTNTPYMVRHWKQNIDGKADAQNEYNYTIAERKNLTGTTDTEVSPEINTYEGFTSPKVQTKTITGDGNQIIDYYYTRNKYTVTLNKGKGVAAVLGDGEYAYGDEVTINVMVLAGYDWVKWSGENESRDLKVTFTMPAKNVEYTTVTMPNPNTKYTIKHWKQKLGGKVDDYENGYELADTDELTGETDSRVSPETKDYEGFKKPDADGISVPITGEGTLVIDYFYKRNSYEVKLNKGEGIEDIKVIGNITGEGKDKYLYEEEVTIEAKVKPGYTWDKWIVGAPFVGIPEGSDTTVPDIVHTFRIGLENEEYTANAIANTDTAYKVQHWQQNITGNAEIQDNKNYTIIENDTEELTGTTGEEVTPEVKEYAGFTSPETQTVTILGDGSLVVNYYYTRNTNTPYKVQHWKENLPTDKNETVENTNPDTVGEHSVRPQTENYTLIETDELTGITGATVTPETKEYAGFTAPETQTVEILGDGSLEVNYYYTRNTNTPYVVKHWKENLPTDNNENAENTNPDTVGAGPVSAQEGQENYTLADTDNLTGTTEATVTPETKEYEGFTAPAPEEVEISADGKLVVNYYYSRNSYTITLNKGKGIESVEGAGTYPYEKEITIDAEIKAGYTWSKWTGSKETTKQSYTFQMPAENVENTAVATANTNTPYQVKHWKQNLGGNAEIKDENNYTLVETYEYTGTTDEEITPEVREYAGFTAPEEETVRIIGDGSLVVNYYYTRNTNTPYVVKHWKENLPTDNNENAENTNPDTVGAGPVSAQEGQENYTLADTDNLTGTTDQEITPETKAYEGFVAPEAETTTIAGNGTTEINYYYTRRNDLTCIVKHIDKGTQKTIFTRTIKELKYEDEINGTEEIMDIEDYTYESIEPETLKIGTGENIIKIYYTKKEGKIIVHHYIYDEKEDKYTTNKLVEDEEITGKIGEQYTTTKSSKIPENYIVVDETPENYTGIIEGGTKEITYYYKLKTPKVDTEVGGEVTEGGSQREDGKWEIKAGEEIKYKINYKTKIEEYKGKVKIEVKAELPKGTKIEEGRCDFAGGTYDKETNTIKWEKEIEEINTFKNGTYIDGIEKDITIIYAEDYVVDEIEPNVTGKTILYYPSGNTGEEDKPLIEDETDGTGKVIIHHYIYDEKTDTYTEAKLVEDEEIVKKVGEEYISKKSKEIPENYECINEKPEGYKGTVTKDPIEVNYYYKLKTPTIDGVGGGETTEGGNQREDGKWEIKAGEEIKYKIKYKTEIEDYKGKAKIEVKAELPEGTRIDEENCNFAGGTYDAETNTITWTKEIEGIDTFENGNYIEEITKDITIVYAEDYVLDEITPKVTGKTTLYYPDDYPIGGEGEGNGTLTEDETDEKGKVIIYHYIYDEKTNTYTDTKLVENEKQKGEIGEEYTTKPSEKGPSNYECINEKPEGYKGKYTKETIKVKYYYKLKTPKTENEIDSTVTEGGTQREDGKWEIKAGEEIKYKINYKTKIEDYKGKVRIEITAKLPEGTGIDEEKCNLAGGIYDKETNTIKWVKEIEEIDTFIDGEYTEEIEKEITIVYDNDYILDDIGLKVKGKTILYYPDDYPIEGDGTLKEDETEKKEKGKIVVHHYIYDKEDNKYTETKVAPDEEIEKEIGENYETKPSEKVPLNYECINEKPEGHTGTIEKGTKEISYYYKLKAPKTEGTGNSNIKTELEQDEEGNWIIKAGEEIEYEIKYEVKIEDYIGKATVEIKAELPEGTKIEQDKCDFDGGIYDEVTNTITWVKEIENIDTFANGQYTETITKNIKIVYAEDYVLKDANLKVTGNIKTYYPDDYPDKGGETLPKEDDPNNPEEKMGKVIVRYVDIDTNEEIINVGAGPVSAQEDEKTQTYRYEITGKIGEAYETEEKEIKYYVLVRSEGNTKGEIKEEEQIVTYYYRKLNFNIGIEKTIGTITLNGKNIKIGNKETSKLEIKKEDIKNTEIIVKYNIKVINTGELRGTSKIVEQIPEGYELAYLPEYWKVMRDETLETNVDLEAGQSKELEVVLRWENKENNLGAKTNIAKIEETKNEANFKDTNEEDNVGKATIVLSIKTGEAVSSIIIVMIMGSLVICSYITIKTVKRKDPEIKDIKFLK